MIIEQNEYIEFSKKDLRGFGFKPMDKLQTEKIKAIKEKEIGEIASLMLVVSVKCGIAAYLMQDELYLVVILFIMHAVFTAVLLFDSMKIFKELKNGNVSYAAVRVQKDIKPKRVKLKKKYCWRVHVRDINTGYKSEVYLTQRIHGGKSNVERELYIYKVGDKYDSYSY